MSYVFNELDALNTNFNSFFYTRDWRKFVKVVLYWYWKKQPQEVFYRNGFLKNFTEFTGKHLRPTQLYSCNFVKKRDSETCLLL